MENPYAHFMESLEKVYGKASDAGFGSAVFHESADKNTAADSIAQKHYQRFLGSKWTRNGETPWLKTWKVVYARPGNQKGDILRELASVADPDARISIPLLTELIEHADAGRDALVAAFNHAEVKQLCVCNIGDGEAMSGILVTAVYELHYACTVIALMD